MKMNESHEKPHVSCENKLVMCEEKSNVNINEFCLKITCEKNFVKSHENK